MAVWAAGRIGVGPGVNSRVFRSMIVSPWDREYWLVYLNASTERWQGQQPGGISGHRLSPVREAIIPQMSMIEQIQTDITEAMKARDEQRLSTLRMVKTALKNREIEKMAPLDDKESQQVLSTLIKQRKDSVEQFLKGGRKELADEEEIAAGVRAVIAEMNSPTIKDMGTVMKNVMARFAGAGVRVDGKQVSELVKRELTPK